MNKHENDRFPQMLENERDADELRAVWRALGDAAPSEALPAERTDEAWASLSARLGLAGAAAEQVALPEEAGGSTDLPADRRSAPVSPSGSWLRAAAVAALLGASVWQAVPVSHTAPEGEQVAVVLPDGSDVMLNAGSELRYRRGFAWIPAVPQGRRVVRLEGEAFFDVRSGERPFQVSTGGARVTVIGTRFNVRARAGSAAVSGVRVDVEEGRVVVAVQGSTAVAELAAGEGVRVLPGADTLVPEQVSAARIGAWRSGGLTVTDEPLAVVVQELALRFGTAVALADSVDPTVRVTAYYPLVTGIDSVLDDLATQQNLRTRRTAVGWELF
jgi:transmembrane sensor